MFWLHRLRCFFPLLIETRFVTCLGPAMGTPGMFDDPDGEYNPEFFDQGRDPGTKWFQYFVAREAGEPNR